MKSLTKDIVKNGFGYYFRDSILPNPDKIVRTKGGYEVLRKLRNDPHLSSCIQSRKSGLLAMEWHIRPNGISTELSEEVETMLRNLDIFNILRDVLDAPLFGFQPIEIIWEETADRIVPKRLIAKPQEWFSILLIISKSKPKIV